MAKKSWGWSRWFRGLDKVNNNKKIFSKYARNYKNLVRDGHLRAKNIFSSIPLNNWLASVTMLNLILKIDI